MRATVHQERGRPSETTVKFGNSYNPAGFIKPHPGNATEGNKILNETPALTSPKIFQGNFLGLGTIGQRYPIYRTAHRGNTTTWRLGENRVVDPGHSSGHHKGRLELDLSPALFAF